MCAACASVIVADSRTLLYLSKALVPVGEACKRLCDLSWTAIAGPRRAGEPFVSNAHSLSVDRKCVRKLGPYMPILLASALDDADSPVRFHVRATNLTEIADPLLAKGGHQLVRRNQLLAHIPTHQFAILN